MLPRGVTNTARIRSIPSMVIPARTTHDTIPVEHAVRGT